MITYQFRLFPTRKQLSAFFKQLCAHQNLYNMCLQDRITEYQSTGKFSSCFEQIKRHTKTFKGQSNYSSLQQTIRRLDKTFKSFFKRGHGFPRHKNRFRTIEYSKVGDGCQILDKHIYLQGIGNVYCKFHRPIPRGKIKRLSITLKQGNMHVNIFVDDNYCIYNDHKTSVGIDFGIQTTITTSDGEKFVSPKFTKRRSKNLARLQRRKQKQRNQRKTKKAIAKIHTKITNQRQDFNHKLSRYMVNKYDIICIEDLKTEDIISNIKNINQRIYDIGIYQLKSFLSYKAENAGKKIVFVNPAYTTQTCSSCGQLNTMDLVVREYSCKCGLFLDRDVNAAKNIMSLGLQTLRS